MCSCPACGAVLLNAGLLVLPLNYWCSYTYTAEDVSKLLQQKKDKGQAPHNIGERADAAACSLHGVVHTRLRVPVLGQPNTQAPQHLNMHASHPRLLAALEKARLGAQLAHAKEHGEDEMAAQ